MKTSKLLFSLFILLCFYACKKETDSKTELGPFTPRPKETFTARDCVDKDSVEYIEGFFNDTHLCFCSQSGKTGSYFRDMTSKTDEIDLIRRTTDDSLMCRICFIRSCLYSRTLPYMLPHPNLNGCERAELYLIKSIPPPIVSACDRCSFEGWDDWDYWNDTNGGITMSITDTANGYLTGQFEGKAYTDHDRREVTVTGGSFHVHLDNITLIQ